MTKDVISAVKTTYHAGRESGEQASCAGTGSRIPAGPIQEILTERRPSGRGSYCYSPALLYGKRSTDSTADERRSLSAQNKGSGSFLSPSQQELPSFPLWMITSCTTIVDSRTVPADLKDSYENVRQNTCYVSHLRTSTYDRFFSTQPYSA